MKRNSAVQAQHTGWRVPRLALLLMLALAAWEDSGRAQDRSWAVFPMLIKLEGIAPIYGAGAGVSDAVGGRLDAYALIARGGADAQGGLVRDIPLGGPDLALNVYGVQVDRAEFQSSFTRGFERDRPVSQEVAGSGFAVTADAWFASRVLKLTVGAAQSTIQLKGFFTDSGDRIDLPGAVLHDVSTLSLLAGLAANWTDAEDLPTRGLRLQADAVTAQGRKGQSDTLTLTYRATGLVPLGSSVTWGVHGMASEASVIRRQVKYDTAAEAAAALEIDCSAVSGAAQQADCAALRDELAAYIAANNRYGTAQPLGGSVYLRGFRELRFRAAHTRLLGTEVRWRIVDSVNRARPAAGGVILEVSPFWEIGQASDTPADLGRASRESAGLAVRLVYKGVPLRLESGQGDGQTSVIFTVGYPW